MVPIKNTAIPKHTTKDLALLTNIDIPSFHEIVIEKIARLSSVASRKFPDMKRARDWLLSAIQAES
jgi:hypothetical protein